MDMSGQLVHSGNSGQLVTCGYRRTLVDICGQLVDISGHWWTMVDNWWTLMDISGQLV